MASSKQQAWLEEFFRCWNATEAARRVGYKWPNKKGPELKQLFADEIAERLAEKAMAADEAAWRMAEVARFDPSKYLETAGRQTWLNVEDMIADGFGHMIEGLKYTPQGAPIYELRKPQHALDKIFDGLKPALGDPDRPLHVVRVYVPDNERDTADG